MEQGPLLYTRGVAGERNSYQRDLFLTDVRDTPGAGGAGPTHQELPVVQGKVAKGKERALCRAPTSSVLRIMCHLVTLTVTR